MTGHPDTDRGDFAQFSRISRMAGNIAEGMISRGFYSTVAERQLIAQVAVDVAHRIVVVLRGPRDGDAEMMAASADAIRKLQEQVRAERDAQEDAL